MPTAAQTSQQLADELGFGLGRSEVPYSLIRISENVSPELSPNGGSIRDDRRDFQLQVQDQHDRGQNQALR